MLLVGLRNDGNQMLKPAGTLSVLDAQGQEVQRQTLQLDTLLPQTAIQYPVLVEGQALGAGQYHAHLQLGYGNEGSASLETGFVVSDQQVEQLYSGNTQALPARPGGQGSGLSTSLLLGLVVGAIAMGAVVGILVARLRPGSRS